MIKYSSNIDKISKIQITTTHQILQVMKNSQIHINKKSNA